MDIKSIQEPAGFNELPKADQIRYVQYLWNRISGNPYDVPVPKSHLALAEQRLAEYRSKPDQSRPAREIIEELRGRPR